MKYTGRIAIIFFCSLFLLGCSEEKLPLRYSDRNIDSIEDFIVSRLDTFSKDLAIVNEDIDGVTNLELEARSVAGLFDVTNAQVLYSKNIHERCHPASLTKVMTALVVLRNGNLNDTITCTNNVSNIEAGATSIELEAGDQLTVEQALYALLMKSANDVGIALAEHVGGSVDSFVNLMNQEARRLGATNTHFANPHGLTDNEHYTTAYDLYLITKEASKYQKFIDIIATDEYELAFNDSTGKDKNVSIITTNLFLRGNYEAPANVKIVGGKTGTTYAAGNCLDLIARDNKGNTYIAIILRVSSRDLINEEMAYLLGEITGS